MALSREQSDTLISHLESFARQQPGMYKLRVGLFAALGYAYIFFTLTGFLVLFVVTALLMWKTGAFYSGLVTWNLAILVVMVVPIFIILRSLWVSFPIPQGLKLQRQDVPSLFALVDKLTSKLKTPRFHYILLIEDFNASVVQIPLFGWLGWQQNYLLVGIPLMQALSPQQFAAVIAHELGHLSGNHSRFTSWIYCVEKTYYQIFEQFYILGDEIALAIFAKFFKWYAPFFSTYSFVLRRMNEYEADSYAAELTGAQNLAQAIINVELKTKFLQYSFWPSIHKYVETRIAPPTNTYTRMSTALLTGVDYEDAIHFLKQALAEKTSNEDTHPCLTDRLKALGCLPKNGDELSLPAPVEISAASEFLGNAFEKFTDYFNQTWQENAATSWRQRYAYAQESLAELKILEKKAQYQRLTIAEAWDRAYWTLEFEDKKAGISLLQEILSREANHISANYLLGQVLLEQNNAMGIEHIEKAIAHNSDKFIEGCELIYSFLKQQGKIPEASLYKERIQHFRESIFKAQKERSYVRANDKFKFHNLPDNIVESVCQKLAIHDDVKTAYLAEKVVQYFPEKHFYILAVKRRWKFVESEFDKPKLVKYLLGNIELPGQYYIIIIDNWSKDIEKKLRQIPEAAIYKK